MAGFCIPMTESLRVEYRKVETLIPFARNPRTHSDAQTHDENVGNKPPRKRGELRPRRCTSCGKEDFVRKDNQATVCQRCSSRKNALSKPRTGPRTGFYVPCQHCGRDFYTYPSADAKYCSSLCRRSHARADRTCKACGGLFSVVRSVLSTKTNASGSFCCRACYEQWLCKPDRITGRGSRWNRIRSSVKDRQPFCAICGTRKRLQVHHIVPFRLTCDNDPKNLVVLCIACHKTVEWVTVEVEMMGVDYFTMHSALSIHLRGRQHKTMILLRKLHEQLTSRTLARREAHRLRA